jgi:dihydroceramide fatty acyl 2-hydroxylase
MGGAAIFLLGLFAWSFFEYAIHGWLGHRFDNVGRRLHYVHHREPRAVFTIGAWLPAAVLWSAGIAFFGMNTGMIFATGVVAGFITYEAIHYRIHFSRPRNSIEHYLRTRHLMHHQAAHNGWFGVTSPLWDRIFGTEPAGPLNPSAVPPLDGPSNVRLLFSFHYLRRDRAGGNSPRI